MRTLVAFMFLVTTATAVEYPVSWSLDGISIIGTVDTDLDTFTMESFINSGPITTYTPVTPIVFDAIAVPSGTSYDVPDTFEGISDDWMFVGPLHALLSYEEGPTSGDGYHISFGGSEALTGTSYGQDERFFNIAIDSMKSATLVAETCSVPESTGLVLGGLGLMALVGFGLIER